MVEVGKIGPNPTESNLLRGPIRLNPTKSDQIQPAKERSGGWTVVGGEGWGADFGQIGANPTKSNFLRGQIGSNPTKSNQIQPAKE